MPDFLIEPISSLVLQSLEQGVTHLHGNPVETVIADANPGYPCRISLEDAREGEELYLFSHSPFSAASAYRETGPVFVRKNAAPATLAVNEIPQVATSRLIVVRAYNSAGTMVAACQAGTVEIANRIHAYFEDERVGFVHIRAAVSGCFLCAARRA